MTPTSAELADKLRVCFLWAKIGGQESTIIGIRQDEGYYETAIKKIIEALENSSTIEQGGKREG